MSSVDPLQFTLTDGDFIEGNAVCADFNVMTHILTMPCLDLPPTNFELGLRWLSGTAKFQLDSFQLAEGDNVGVTVAYWDPKSDAWRFVDKEIDRVNKVIRVRSNHLSEWVWFDTWNWEIVTSSSGVFTVYYDPGFPGPAFATGLFPDNKQFAVMVAEQLDETLNIYKTAGFKVPSEIDVMLSYNKELHPNYKSPWIADKLLKMILTGDFEQMRINFMYLYSSH